MKKLLDPVSWYRVFLTLQRMREVLTKLAASCSGRGSTYEGKILILFQVLVLAALIGLALSFRRHRKPLPLIVGIPSVLLILYAFHIRFSEILNYIGLFGLLSASALNIMENRRCARCKAPEVKP